MPTEQNGGERPDRSGQDWFGDFITAHGRVTAELTWMTFAIGQAGVLMAYDRDAAREMIAEALVQNRDDLKQATDKLNDVVADMVANAQRNMEPKEQES